nr:sce7726 family protein [Myxococcus sp. CA040A]
MLKSDYRTDYVFRAAIAKKIFLGRHSPSTTALLPELRVWRSRVDLLMLNGTSTAYEIKSGFDTTRRLAAQVADYLKMFDRVYVVTEERLVGAVSKELPDSIGIIVLTPDYTLRSVRGCVPNAERVDIAAIADALRKEELCELTRRICGRVPEVPSSRLFDDCLEALRRDARPKDVHDEAVKILKRRAVLGSEAFRDVEEALVPAFIESGLHHSEWPTLTGILRRLTVGNLLGGL